MYSTIMRHLPAPPRDPVTCRPRRRGGRPSRFPPSRRRRLRTRRGERPTPSPAGRPTSFPPCSFPGREFLEHFPKFLVELGRPLQHRVVADFGDGDGIEVGVLLIDLDGRGRVELEPAGGVD